MRIVYFTHSLRSCWNHGNAHFLRGVISELEARGHDVRCFEPARSWSLDNLLADHGEDGLRPFEQSYPGLRPRSYGAEVDAAALCDGADLVVVHEWNDPALVAAVGRARQDGGDFVLLFHDTHHRAVSDPRAIDAFDLAGYDGVLAFGETLAEVYRGWGWGGRVWVWHEAADLRLFHPPAVETERRGLVWIGNWGDGERTEELDRFLFGPAQALGMALDVYGVRYPADALGTLRRRGAIYRGWLPNARAPDIFASAPPCTFHAASMSSACPVSRRSASSKPSRAAYPWSARPGRTARRCSARGRTSWWRATAAKCGTTSPPSIRTPRSATHWCRTAFTPSDRAIAAPTGWTN